MNFLLKILDSFIAYLEENNNSSFIARIFGVYTIRSKLFLPVHLILMENTVRLRSTKSQKVCFDLKGSIVHREVKLKENQEMFWQKGLNYKGDLKDINFLSI